MRCVCHIIYFEYWVNVCSFFVVWKVFCENILCILSKNNSWSYSRLDIYSISFWFASTQIFCLFVYLHPYKYYCCKSKIIYTQIYLNRVEIIFLAWFRFLPVHSIQHLIEMVIHISICLLRFLSITSLVSILLRQFMSNLMLNKENIMNKPCVCKHLIHYLVFIVCKYENYCYWNAVLSVLGSFASQISKFIFKFLIGFSNSSYFQNTSKGLLLLLATLRFDSFVQPTFFAEYYFNQIIKVLPRVSEYLVSYFWYYC